MAVGGRDLLILDAKNVAVALAAADDAGKGTLDTRSTSTARRRGATTSPAFGTYLRDAERGLYNLYVIDPSEQQILRYSPAADGSGFPAQAPAWLATARDVTR